MSNQSAEVKSLTSKQVEILDTWYALERANLHRIVYSIAKLTAIAHVDGRYVVKPEEAESLITVCDLVYELIESQ